jgi:hypothetical protein
VLRKCGPRDQIVRWHKPPGKPRWMEQEAFDALPETIDVRELRRKVAMPDGHEVEITLITTLLDEETYPAQELIAVLKARWSVEVNLRHLKTTMHKPCRNQRPERGGRGTRTVDVRDCLQRRPPGDAGGGGQAAGRAGSDQFRRRALLGAPRRSI